MLADYQLHVYLKSLYRLEVAPVELENEGTGMYVLKKKKSEEDLAMYSGMQKSKQNRRGKKEKRKSLLNLVRCVQHLFMVNFDTTLL